MKPEGKLEELEEELEEGETLMAVDEQHGCLNNSDCGAGQWCHSGWNGQYYGVKFCVAGERMFGKLYIGNSISHFQVYKFYDFGLVFYSK